MEIGHLIFGELDGGYPFPRGDSKEPFKNDHIFRKFLEDIGCDIYGYCFAPGRFNQFSWRNESGGISTDVFDVSPRGFYYRPSDFRLSWYKYALRDAYSNRQISHEEFVSILDGCRKSIAGESA